MKKSYNAPEFKKVPFDFEEIMDEGVFVSEVVDIKRDQDDLDDE